ncbi:MAG: alpha/beta hydrolase-fold protein [Caldilineaceae bacterium]
MNSQIWRRPDEIVSPEILADNSVIFRVQAEDAGSVKLTGTWPVPLERTIPMEKQDATLYEVKVGPLPSDMYEYEFIIDGMPTLDPRNRAVTRDGAWIQNCLMVPGKQAELYDVNQVPHGKVSALWYPSPTLGAERRMVIYTPPGYDNEDWQYPVLYLLHGGGGDEEVWLSRGRVNYILDNLIAAGAAQPMIVVMPNGYPNHAGGPLHRPRSAEQTPGISPMISGRFEASLINDIVPYVEQHYRVKADPNHRAISGFSMGGYHTQMITNSHPGVFNYIGVMSMGLFSGLPGVEVAYNRDEHLGQLKALKNAQPKLYWIGMGTEDFLYKNIAPLLELYDEVGLQYLYRENAGHHNWNSWRLYLTEFVPLLFQ